MKKSAVGQGVMPVKTLLAASSVSFYPTVQEHYDTVARLRQPDSSRVLVRGVHTSTEAWDVSARGDAEHLRDGRFNRRGSAVLGAMERNARGTCNLGFQAFSWLVITEIGASFQALLYRSLSR